MLDDAPNKGHSEIVSWSQSGLSFKIHDTNAIVPILANYFRQTKYKSLLRQLQGYGFKRVTNGEMKGQVSHPMFVRGNRKACMEMKRKQGKASTTSTSKSSATATNTKSLSSSSTKKKKSNSRHGMIENIIAATVTPSSSQAAAQQQPILSAEFRQPLSQEALSARSSSAGKIATKAAQQKQRILPSSCTSSSSSAGTSGERKPLEINMQMGGQQFQTTTHSYHYQQQQQQQDRNHNQTGLDALRVEIGCTFSTSPSTSNNKPCSSSSLKRTAPSQQQQYHNHFVTHQNLEKQLCKRQRNSKNNEQQQQAQLQQGHYGSSSFLLPTEGGNNNSSRDQFDQLEKLIPFSPQEILSSSSCSQQQKQHTQQQQQLLFHQSMDAAGSSFGSLDLDISLTTTTTTTTHSPNVKVESTSSSQVVCNNQQFILPFELEPTPFRTAENSNHSSNQNSNSNITAVNTMANSDIITSTFLPKPVTVVKDTPTATPTQTRISSSNIVDSNVLENVIPISSSTMQQELSSEVRSDPTLETSDDIDMQIADAFDDDISDDEDEIFDSHGWPKKLQQLDQQHDQTTTHTNTTCDPVVSCEEKEQGQGKEFDCWTKGVQQIVFNGTSDCVLEPELFQLEAQRLQFTNDSDNNINSNNAVQQQRPLQQPSHPQQPHHQHVLLQQQKQQMQRLMAQQQQHLAVYGHLPVQQQHRLQQSQGLAGGPYPIISKPMAFAPLPPLHTEIS